MGIITWFSKNPIAANILLLLIVIMGVFSSYKIDKQLFPKEKSNIIEISIAYPGASSSDVDSNIIVKVEESIEHIEGIKSIHSTAYEGLGVTDIELKSNSQLRDVIDIVRSEVDAIAGLPEDSRKPVIRKKAEGFDILWLSIKGDIEYLSLYNLALSFQKELKAIPEISKVNIADDNEIIISIDTPEEVLRKYQLTFDDISNAIRHATTDTSAGKIESSSHNLSLRVKETAHSVQRYSDITIRVLADGSRLKLKDIATIKETLLKKPGVSRFDRQQAITLSVSSADKGNDIAVSKAVHEWLKHKQDKLPHTTSITVWGDASYYLSERLDMMVKNLFFGALLVFIVLSLFLRLDVAFWVMIGIPVTFLGAIWLMPLPPYFVSINIVSLFAFILVLGIVVDDGIIIGESIYTETIDKKNTVNGVTQGVKKVLIPASFGVLTTIAAFFPMLFIGGAAASYFESIAVVVILCLLFSLIESKLILPSHLAHLRSKQQNSLLNTIQQRFSQSLKYFIYYIYKPLLKRALYYRYTTISVFLSALIITLGLMSSGVLKVVVFPNIPSDFIAIKLEMTPGSTSSDKNTVLTHLEDIIYQSQENLINKHRINKGFLKHVATYSTGVATGEIIVELKKSQDRKLNAYQISDIWRDAFPKGHHIQSIEIIAGENAGGGKPINIQLFGSDRLQLVSAAQKLKEQLINYRAVYDAQTDYRQGADEIVISMKPSADLLNIRLSDISRKVRQGFHGEEIERFYRNGEEITVWLRYPESKRKRYSTLENMFIVSPQGDRIPISEVAQFSITTGYESIRRTNGQQSITVSANVYDHIQAPNEILNEVTSTLSKLLSHYPAVQYNLSSSSKEASELEEKLLFAALISLFLIYSILAIPLKSYIQPLIILVVVPFGIIGAAIGHILFGINLSMLSIFGMIALAGVLVNDSLILTDHINKNKEKQRGFSLAKITIEASQSRFRAIILTSLTTFFGLMPILFETSLQAQLIIPMAVSLSFGILFSTVITLILIPCVYLVLDDLKQLLTYTRKNF